MRCVVLALALVAGCTALSLEKVHLVDHNDATGNFLFRGDMPCNDTAFAIDDLRAYLAQRASEAGVTLPSDYYLVDISLNNVFDFNKFERDFWADGAHASIGELVNYPMGLAGVFPPSFYNASAVKQMALSQVWWFDQTPQRVQKVREMLDTAASKPQVLYVHCTAGCDRTGQFVGSYRMQFHATNATEMYALDTTECGRSPNWYGTGGLEWYCIYYEETNGTALGDCESFAKCDLFGKCKPADAAVEDGAAELAVGNRRAQCAAAMGSADASGKSGLAGLPALPVPASALPIVTDDAEIADPLQAFDTLNLAIAAVRNAQSQGDAAYQL